MAHMQQCDYEPPQYEEPQHQEPPEYYDDLPLDLRPILPCRTLSTHHWMAAEAEMARNRTLYQWAGTFRGILPEENKWVFRIVRQKVSDTQAVRQTIQNGEIKSVEKTTLPKSHRCEGYTSLNKRCKNKTYWSFCDKHTRKL